MDEEPGFKKVDEVPFLLGPDRYFYAMWYFPFPPDENDILGGNVTGLIWRLNDEPKSWRMTYRFRYYKSMRVEDGNDRKKWYMVHATGPEEEVCPKLLRVARELHSLRDVVWNGTEPNEPDEFDFLMVQGDNDKMIELALKENKPWLNMREALPDERKKFQPLIDRGTIPGGVQES